MIPSTARETLQIPSGQRYELCRASMPATRNNLGGSLGHDGSTLYLAGRDAKTDEILSDTTPCTMCRRLIINAGIHRVICRISEDDYTVTSVRDWIFNDDSVKPRQEQ